MLIGATTQTTHNHIVTQGRRGEERKGKNTKDEESTSREQIRSQGWQTRVGSRGLKGGDSSWPPARLPANPIVRF